MGLGVWVQCLKGLGFGVLVSDFEFSVECLMISVWCLAFSVKCSVFSVDGLVFSVQRL